MQGKPLQCRNTVINGGPVRQLRWIKLTKVDFTEGGKPENPEKNAQSTGETNYNNSTHMSFKFFEFQVLTPIRLGLIWNSVVKGNMLTEFTICSPRIHVNYQAESFNIISHILAVLKISISDMTVSGYVGSLNVCSEVKDAGCQSEVLWFLYNCCVPLFKAVLSPGFFQGMAKFITIYRNPLF